MFSDQWRESVGKVPRVSTERGFRITKTHGELSVKGKDIVIILWNLLKGKGNHFKVKYVLLGMIKFCTYLQIHSISEKHSYSLE